jgi:orotidine-5'-phosphate decarboxylase
MPENFATAPFGERLEKAFTERGHLCLGLDPHAFLLRDWGLDDTPHGLREFCRRVIETAVGTVGIIKPQVAFFERHGSAGYAVLESVIAQARAAGLLVVADAKRGDVGSTVEAYGAAWLTPGSPLEADALTVSAYQGVGSLRQVIDLALSSGKGVFILAATSNPESVETQLAIRHRGRLAGSTVASSIVNEVQALNSENAGLPAENAGLGSVGVVIGATIDTLDYGITADLLRFTPILAPGFGEQGAMLSDLPDLFGPVAPNVIANVGRAVLRAGPAGLRQSLLEHADQLARAMAA